MRACLVVTMFCTWLTSLQAGELTANQLVDAYAESVSRVDKAKFDVVAKRSYYGPTAPNGYVIGDTRLKVWRDGDRMRMVRSETNRRRINGKDVSGQISDEWLFPGKGFVLVNKDPATGAIRGTLARLDGSAEEVRRKYSGFVHSPILGHFFNDSSLLPEVLRDSSLSMRAEHTDGIELHVLESVGKWGRHLLWLDSSRGHTLMKIEQRKGPADWVVEGRSLKSFPPISGNEMFPAASRQAVTRILRTTRVERVGNQFFITAFILDEAYEFDNGQQVSIRTDVELQRFELGLDIAKADPFSIGSPVPDGSSVNVENLEGISFEWRDGKIVKSIRQDSLANLRGNWFQRGSWLGRGLILLCVIALVGLVTALFYYRRRVRSA